MSTPSEEGKTATVSSDVADRIVQRLTANEAAEALSIANDDANKDVLTSASWDLVRNISDLLTDETESKQPDVVDACEVILLRLVEIGNPKELVLVLLEQMDTFNSDLKFKCLLQPVQRCLQNLPGKKGHSLAVAMETIQGHIEALPLPQDQCLQGKERVLLDCDPEVQRINDVISALIAFITPFTEEVAWKKTDLETREKTKKHIRELTRYIVRLLDKPMSVLDLSYDDAKGELSKSNSRMCAEKLVRLMTCLQVDYFKALSQMVIDNESIARETEKQKEQREKNPEDSADELDQLSLEEPLPMIGLSMLAYLVFGEKLGLDSVPQIYVPQYLLEFNCRFISILLQKQHSLVVLKGLTLFHSILDRMSTGSLSATILEWDEMKNVLEALIQVITACPVKDICQLGVKILPSLLQKFDSPGRYKALYMLFSVASHAGLAGYATQLLKNEIDATLKLDVPDANFTGAKLNRLLKLVFVLPSGAETDLLEQSERVMAALNLLRYLVLRDKPAQNVTGIWDVVPQLQQNYCELVRTGVNMSKAHYELEIEQTKKKALKKKGATAGAGEPEVSFTVGGQEMSALDKDQQLQVLAMAIHTFDMMGSVVGRVSELIDQQLREVPPK